MIAGAGYVRWQKRAGTFAMVVLVAALLSFADALVGGLTGKHGTINLVPDSRYAISGPLPPKTTEIKEFVIEGQARNGRVRLVPETIFSGYLFGGAMWRGAIVVDPLARQGRYVISVKDRFGEKQNPALVFKVRVWPDQATRNANAPSLLTRMTGKSPYLFAIGFALCGIAAGGANFLLGRLWARHLAAHHCGEIYKLRHTEHGTEITCEIHCHSAVHPGMAGAIYRASGEMLSAAHVSTCENNQVLMLVDTPQFVRLGDVACLQLDSTEGRDVEAG